MQVLGEQSVISNGRHLMGAEALQETKIAEIPAETLKPLYEKSPATFKLFVRGLLEESKQARIQLRTMRMETDKSPCPQMQIPRIFTLAHLLPRHIGKKDSAKPDEIQVSWMAIKQYANRFFGEPPVRLRSLMDLLKKIGKATFEVKVNEEEEEELTGLTITGVQALEDFAEFYQYHLFKGQHSEAIYVDPLALKIAKGPGGVQRRRAGKSQGCGERRLQRGHQSVQNEISSRSQYDAFGFDGAQGAIYATQVHQ